MYFLSDVKISTAIILQTLNQPIVSRYSVFYAVVNKSFKTLVKVVYV